MVSRAVSLEVSVSLGGRAISDRLCSQRRQYSDQLAGSLQVEQESLAVVRAAGCSDTTVAICITKYKGDHPKSKIHIFQLIYYKY